jgi:hypothetical protein
MPDAPPATTFTVLAGPLKGKRLVVDDAVDEVLIGSDSECRLSLEVPGVSPLHARVWIDAQGATVHDTHSPRGVFINDTRVEVEAPLADGDVLWLGTPGDAESVMILFRLRGAGEGVPAPAPPPALVTPAPDLDDPMLSDLIGAEEIPPRSSPVPDTPAPLEDFVVDETAPTLTESEAGSTDAVQFLLDDGLGGPAVAPPPPASAPPADARDDDLFFVEDVGAAPAQAGSPSPPAAPPPVAPLPAPALAAPVPVAAAATPAPAPAPHLTPPPAPVRARPERAAAHEPTAPAEPVRPRRPPMPRPDAVRPVLRRSSGGRGPSPRVLALAAVGLVVVLAGSFVLTRVLGAPSIRGIDPGRVRAGDAITLTGRNFSVEPGRNVVQFEGARAGRVLQASSTRLQVEVPDIPSAPGRPNRVPVTVTVDGRESDPMDIAVYLAPRVHGLAPNVAMPGEEVVLAGTGWSTGVTVTFGGRAAEVVETTPTALKVRVPALEGAAGTSAPVVVTMAGESSNPAPFLLGHLPLVLGMEPRSAGAGDVLVISGRGFQAHAPSNDVRIGGTRALVTSAADGEIRVMVPWVPPGTEVPIDIKVPGADYVGQAVVSINPPADPVEFRFTAEPLLDAPDHDHAILSTGLGPAFVVSAGGGRSAAARAAEAVRRLNDAASPLKASLSQDVEMRGLDLGSPALVLTGSGETLLDITDEDAAAYNEDWTRLRGRGGPVTRGRLAVWWGAVARDLVRLLVRREAPLYAGALASEGRPLAELHAAARKTARMGIPRDVVEKARPALREGLRTLALRVPPSVVATVETVAGAAPPTAAQPTPPPLELQGDWTGRESEGGEPRRVEVTFTREGGSLSYQRALSLTLPLIGVELDRRGNVRFAMHTARGARYYAGRWDGQKIDGRIFSDPERQTGIGTFTLSRVR